MIKRYKTIKEFYLFNMVLFLAFAFEFFIRGDSFLGFLLIFNGLINFIAYQQIPRRIAPITVILNLFNFMISVTACYNYSDIGYTVLFIVWTILSGLYLAAVLRQIYGILASRASRKRTKKRNN